ncbi:MAG: hypothetical protein VKL42_01035 [Snowella sp.]|nr:hypothetical protein [Snowella sp.]
MSVWFEPAIQAGLNSGIYELIKDQAGNFLPMARDIATGRVAGIGRLTQETMPILWNTWENSTNIRGIANLAQGAMSINPLFSPITIATNLVEMVQVHRGFQKTYNMLDTLQASVGVLQATTALIGVGTIAGVALSAVNLQQTLKLREDVRNLRLEVKDGFVDLKKALNLNQADIINRLDQMENNIEFRQHRTVLVQAYGQFIQSLIFLKNSLQHPDFNARNAGISNVQLMLNNSLAAYNNPLLFEETSIPGKMRRKECSWAIDQAITMTYQLQSAYEVVSDRIDKLQSKIRQDLFSLISACQSEDEIEFVFPEVMRICNHDLVTLETWKNQINWIDSLSLEERKDLLNLSIATSDIADAERLDANERAINLSQPPEQLFYESIKTRSHFGALRDQLKFMVKPEFRQQHESYIVQSTINSSYQALAPSNWQEVPDLTVANLYWYLKEK